MADRPDTGASAEADQALVASDEAGSRLHPSGFDRGRVKSARPSPADIAHAKAAAERAGLRLASIEKRPDGTVKLEFGEEPANDWRAGSPLYSIK